MIHKLILKVKKFQLSGAKRFGKVEEKPPGGGVDSTLPYHLGLTASELTHQLLYMNFPSLELKIFQKDLKSTLPSSAAL